MGRSLAQNVLSRVLEQASDEVGDRTIGQLPLLAQKRKMVKVARNLAMSVVVPDEILTVTCMTEAEMLQEIAVMLFQREKLTLAQASRFAGMHRVAFQHLLASRHVPVHYGVEDFEQDIQNLREMGRL